MLVSFENVICVMRNDRKFLPFPFPHNTRSEHYVKPHQYFMHTSGVNIMNHRGANLSRLGAFDRSKDQLCIKVYGVTFSIGLTQRAIFSNHDYVTQGRNV